MRAEPEQARARIAELEAQVAKTPRNSSKPQSSDGLAKPAPKSLRTKTGRRPGGQAGHPGATLRMVDDPDVRVTHEPGPCGGRGTSLAGRPVTRLERRQVFDLPELRPHVTEHQLVERECGCRTRTKATVPAIYLYSGQFLSTERTAIALALALAELVGIPLSAGTVAAMTARTAAGIDALGVLTGFTGVVVHDAWAPYDTYTYTCATHQLCVAHLLRELQAVSDTAPAGTWCWAAQAADALVALHRLTVDATTTGNPGRPEDAGSPHPGAASRRPHRDQPDLTAGHETHGRPPRPGLPARRPRSRLPAGSPTTCGSPRTTTAVTATSA
ncbi:DUF6444 domain-containing protein [Parafrankia elaeagni]|uniref:DUF6444 domain-containing protein n=1 Tax=Parafrankia elaeagni TaxID=222534 RepID=UPI00039E3ABB|nr:DUF6444 domain-containing protein [Parafrankia elaeagni]